jgi:hypothetical protein
MKRFLWLLPILFVLISGSTFADTIIGLVPNDGTGDNFGIIQRGGGVTIQIGGGIPAFFFSTDAYAPGSMLGGATDIFFDSGFIESGGNTRDLAFISGPGTLFLSSFTLPTNGKDFTVRVEIDFTISAIIADTGQPLDVSGGRVGKITFHFFEGSYFADQRGFTVTPEPSTLELMGTGLISILALARKRLGM